MTEITGSLAFCTPSVFVSFAEAAGEIEQLVLRDPAALRKILPGVVLVLGIAIIVIRAFFNRRIVSRSAAGGGLAEEKSGGLRTSEPVKLKPAKLVEIHENREYAIPMDTGLTIGRGFDNMIPVKNPSVSRNHAKIVPEPAGYVIYDLGSKKGTFVNGEMISRRILKNSDIIEIAREDFMFYYR